MEQVNYSDWIFIIDTAWGDRWQIYHRLQELEISCECATGKPLTVAVETPTAAAQVWSVARQPSIGRSQLVDWLNRCFTLHAVGIAAAGRENRNGGELHHD
jgi:hypothetical protein